MENTIDTLDRISLLPEFIIHKILSNLLDSPEALVRMSVLSKDWFSLMASFPILDFHEYNIMSVLFGRTDFEWDYDYVRDAFFKNIAYTTSRFCKQNVSAHTLTIGTDLLKPMEVEIIKDCLESILKKGVRVLNIFITYHHNRPMLRLPNTLLSAYALTSLTIYECELPSSLMFDVVMFKSLKQLSMSRVPIDEGVIEYLTTSCPLLEEICLKDCHGLTTFCVYKHNTLQKVEIFCKSNLERIDIEAPNLRYFHLMSNKDKAPYMNMASCNKLTTFCYQGSPLKSFNDFLSNFPMIENLSLGFTSPCNNMKLPIHSLRRFELHSKCDLEEIDINTPNLLLFTYYGKSDHSIHTPFLSMNEFESESKSVDTLFMNESESETESESESGSEFESVDTLWFQKLRRFLDKSNVFKVLRLFVKQGSIDVEELKGIKSPPYELEHVELFVSQLQVSSGSTPILDAVLWCCRTRSLTLNLTMYSDNCHVVQNTYETLLKQENKSRTNIRFVLSNFGKSDEQHFNDLKLVLKALSLNERISRITFIKEEGAVFTVCVINQYYLHVNNAFFHPLVKYLSSCPRSRIMEHVDLEFSWSAGLRNIFVMTEVQKVKSLLVETGFCGLVFSRSRVQNYRKTENLNK